MSKLSAGFYGLILESNLTVSKLFIEIKTEKKYWRGYDLILNKDMHCSLVDKTGLTVKSTAD